MKFIADFHIHSHFSRATAKNLDLQHLYKEAQIKGITLVGTGDFTHPGWFAELSENLIPAEDGLFALKPELAQPIDKTIPATCKAPVRFVLTVEISNIYKKNGFTRKNHNVLFMPTLDAVQSLNAQLDRIGNIHSDGRPILGLDAHHLLDMTLNTHEKGFLVPAHIWTPWFSLLGSKSGFDTLTECFEDLSSHIFAVETGLSSDPLMNRRVSFLDNLTLVSNSDAHSPDKLGREANLFNTDLSYPGIYNAMKTGIGFDGTIEFYPEEGKYHLDGHRKCDLRLTPSESQTHDGICPKCGKPLTLGVLYRVNELADRDEKSVDSPYFESLIPLKEMLSEILQKGPKTKTVATHYQTAIHQLGSEFYILRDCPLDQINQANIPMLSEAIARLRSGKVFLQGGYDGEFGTVKVFEQSELDARKGQKFLFSKGGPKKRNSQKTQQQPAVKHRAFEKKISEKKMVSENKTIDLNSAQQEIVSCKDSHLIIMAGPGTGKTRTLTHRIVELISKQNVMAKNILAVTFTQKAATEMNHRLRKLCGASESVPMVSTFHGLCLHILENECSEIKTFRVIDETEQEFCIQQAISKQDHDTKKPSVKQCKKWIETAKQQCKLPTDEILSISDHPLFPEIYETYNTLLNHYQVFDFEEIIFRTIRLFQNSPAVQSKWQRQFPYIFVDEYQDINFSQYQLVNQLVNPQTRLCVIGDPDQAIYGFRGSDVTYFQQFMDDFPGAKCLKLTQNYRSTETILSVSEQVISQHSLQADRQKIFSDISGPSQIHIHEAATEKSEASLIVKTIEQLMGGISHFSLDSGRVDATTIPDNLGFSDFAILYRTHDIGNQIADALDRSGIPYHTAFKQKQSLQVKSFLALLRLIADQFQAFDLSPLLTLVTADIKPDVLNEIQKMIERDFTQSIGIEQLKQAIGHYLSAESRKYWDLTLEMITDIFEKAQTSDISQCIEYALNLNAFNNLSINDQSYFDRLRELSKTSNITYAQFFSQIALFQDIDVIPDHVEKVSLMTMHAAKGLEFPVVFIAGCEDSIIPFRGFGPLTDDLINEERRLFYVAVTRAQHLLYCTYARTRYLFGKKQKQEMSMFLKAIEKKLIAHHLYQKSNKRPSAKNFLQKSLI